MPLLIMIEQLIVGLIIFKKYYRYYLSCEDNVFRVQVLDESLMTTEILSYQDHYQLLINNWSLNKDLGLWEFNLC